MPGTAPTNDILSWFRVQRLLALAQKVGETFPSISRGGSYGEQVVEILSDKQHKFADEGSYYMTRSPTVGTGLATIAAQSSFADASPFLIVTNGNPVGGKSIYLDYIKLTSTVAGTNGTNLLYATKLDNIARWASGGWGSSNTGVAQVMLGPYPTNTAAQAQSAAQVYAGALVAVASSSQARTLSNGICRTAITVVNDQYLFNFAGCDMALDGVLVSGTNIAQRSIIHAPVVIGPGASFLLHIWAASQTVASNFELEMGHVER